MEERIRSKKIKRALPLAAVIAAVILASVLLLNGCSKQREPSPPATEAASAQTSAAAALKENPIDFSYWQDINEEIYAFISVPDTNIEYPILQSTKDDNYYLRRSYEKKSFYRGCIFTQSHNSLDFSDPVTVIYGHNTDKNDMFSQLLYFQNEEFFAEHEYFYIYTPGHILTYRIISAYTYDNRHILNSFDFSDAAVLEEYQSYMLDPATFVKNTREGVSLTLSDKAVVLSTCAEAHSGGDTRYLVNGVMIKDEQTL